MPMPIARRVIVDDKPVSGRLTQSEVLEWIKRCHNYDELSFVNREVVERLRQVSRSQVYDFRPGQCVSWNSRRLGAVVYGTIERLGHKNIKVRQDDGKTLWTIPAGMLTLVK